MITGSVFFDDQWGEWKAIVRLNGVDIDEYYGVDKEDAMETLEEMLESYREYMDNSSKLYTEV